MVNPNTIWSWWKWHPHFFPHIYWWNIAEIPSNSGPRRSRHNKISQEQDTAWVAGAADFSEASWNGGFLSEAWHLSVASTASHLCHHPEAQILRPWNAEIHRDEPLFHGGWDETWYSQSHPPSNSSTQQKMARLRGCLKMLALPKSKEWGEIDDKFLVVEWGWFLLRRSQTKTRPKTLYPRVCKPHQGPRFFTNPKPHLLGKNMKFPAYGVSCVFPYNQPTSPGDFNIFQLPSGKLT